MLKMRASSSISASDSDAVATAATTAATTATSSSRTRPADGHCPRGAAATSTTPCCLHGCLIRRHRSTRVRGAAERSHCESCRRSCDAVTCRRSTDEYNCSGNCSSAAMRPAPQFSNYNGLKGIDRFGDLNILFIRPLKTGTTGTAFLNRNCRFHILLSIHRANMIKIWVYIDVHSFFWRLTPPPI